MLSRHIAIAIAFTCSSLIASGITPAEYAARRAKVASQIGPNAIAVILSAQPSRRNGDVDWPFRQSDNLLYLTGIGDPDATLVLIPGDEQKEIMFVRDRNPQQELWTGRIPTHDEITSISGVQRVESKSRVRRFLAAAVEGLPFSFGTAPAAPYQTPGFPAFLRAVREGHCEAWLAFPFRGGEATSPEQQFAADLQKRYPEVKIRDATPLLRGMRVIKSPAEVALLERAIQISDAAHKAGMKRTLSASNEREVQATIEYTFRNMGACCWGYPSIVASGANATTLHYVSDDAPIVRNGLMLVDAGAEVEGYSADVTRTYPANGKFSNDQRAVYEAVLEAQNASIALMRPGHTFREMNDKAIEILGPELLALGLISKNDPAQVRWYLPYAISHQIGLDVHDPVEPGTPFMANMVVTNEPGIYVRRDDVLASETFKALPAAEQQSIRTALDRYNGIGVRIEDDLLITDGAPRILSANSPRTVAEIEKFLAALH